MFTDVNILASNVIRVDLAAQVVVDDAYYDIANYSLTTATGDGPAVVRILQTNPSSTDTIYVITNTMEPGFQYTLNISGLNSRDGTPNYTASGDFVTRVTKLDSILRSIPNHYDTRTDSNLFAFLAAVGASDDIIGGSRSDSITFS